jgi:hypothetical protein
MSSALDQWGGAEQAIARMLDEVDEVEIVKDMVPYNTDYEMELYADTEDLKPETVSQYRAIRPLDEDEVKSIVSQEISNAIGGFEGSISRQRTKAMEYYRGDYFGNEVEGRSSVVLTDVRDTIEWVLPSLTRVLLGGRYIARYLPNEEEDEPMAAQATEVINQIFRQELDGFMVCHDWFKTALLEKNAFVRSYYEERIEPQWETYEGQDEFQIQQLLGREGVEPVEYSEREDGLYDIRIIRRDVRRAIKVDGIPPEEFLIARRAIKLDDHTPFCAHRKKVTVSDLIAMGYDEDLVADLPSDDSPEFSEGRTTRRDDTEDWPDGSADRYDAASREIWLTHCFIRIDEDGDGYAEARMITVAGDSGIHVLEDEPINHNPFSSITPVPMPYKFFGLSLADLVMDLQLIRSTLLRQMLDNLYQTNNSMKIVEDGAVTLDDLLVTRPGGIIRADHVDAVKSLETTPFSPMAMGMLEWLEGVKENRTGITKYNQGLDAESLNQTATGISKIMDAAQARIEQFARIFAESGLKDLFRKLLKLYASSPMKERTIRLRGEWITFDPSEWNTNMDVEIEVGLGIGQANDRIKQLQMILDLYGQLQGAGISELLVEPKNVHNTLTKLVEAMGFKIPEDFFTDPGQKQPSPKPDPKMEQVTMQATFNAEQNKLKSRELDIKEMDARLDHEAKLEEMNMRERLEVARIESNERIASLRGAVDLKKEDKKAAGKPRQAEGGSGA